jgi:hypothetical protein
MGDYDKAARYSARSEPHGFLRWLVPELVAKWSFEGWADTSTIPFPGDPDRICDLVGEFVHASDDRRRCLLDIEFQSGPDADMPERFGEYLCRLRREKRHGRGQPGKYLVHGVLVSLSGPAQTIELDMTEPDLDGTGLHLTTLVRHLPKEDAAATLAEIAAGRMHRCMLSWIPLMHGGCDPAIIDKWREVAGEEPDPHRKADYGQLAKVLADCAGCGDLWRRRLEDWDVEKSKFLEEEREEARMEVMRKSVRSALEYRFGTAVPDDVTSAIATLTDAEELDRWFRAAVTADSLDAFREAVQQNGEKDEGEHGEEQPQVRERRAVLEQLRAQLTAHSAPPPVSSR